jgi:hypothetical protein
MRARLVLVAAFLGLTCLAPRAQAEEGTQTDGRSGLVWVADAEYAVTSGFASDVVMPRARALRMVAAMNAGRLPNYGRRDWRLPTQRELKRWLRRQGLPPAAAAPGMVRTWPVVGAATLPGLTDVAILATNSVRLEHHARVGGDVVVNDSSPGPTLGPGGELHLDHHARITGDVQADSVRLDKHSQVGGGATYNTLSNAGSIGGSLATPLPLPVFPLLPVFHTAVVRAGAADITVAGGETVVLGAGAYGLIQVAPLGRVVLSGGVYEVRGVELQAEAGCGHPCAVLELAGATDLRIAQRLAVGHGAAIRPAVGSGVTAADVVVYVGGVNGGSGAPDALPAAAAFGEGASLRANVYAPNGTVRLDRHVTARGSLIARDAELDHHATLELESFFVNRPPVAQPTSASTEGAAPITIVLRGSDPDADDLTFTIAAVPDHGTLGPVVEAPPPAPPGEPGRPQGDPPRTEATVTYTPATAGDLEDAFTFRVTDPAGSSGTAVVRINPLDDEPPLPDPTTVEAEDVLEETPVAQPVTVTFVAAAPAGVELTFAILPATGPARGTLGALQQGTETPRRSASVAYTPEAGFSGVDSFQYEACGTIGAATVCDSATARIEVIPAPVAELAPDQGVSTPQDTTVTIALGALGSAGGPASGAATVRVIGGKAVLLDPSEVAGNVADANGDGLGDNHNDNLAGGAPVLVAAGVGLSGGAGSNGTVRVQVEWDLDALAPVGAGDSARVVLTTNRGTVDTLDTFFFAGAGGDGELTDADFQSNVEQLAGVAMPVTGSQGADGTFTFDVRQPLNDALGAGATHLVVQGRVDESRPPGRGLQLYSSADNTANDGKRPALVITTPPPLPPITFTVLSLPLHGVLIDGLGSTISALPYTLPSGLLTYRPDPGFQGADGFDYSAELGTTIDSGRVSIFVNFLDCATHPAGCDDGR